MKDPKSQIDSIANHTKREQLTPREQEVLKLILEAKSTREIAFELSLSVNTIETHRKNLFLKFEVKNVVALVVKAMREEYFKGIKSGK